MTVLTQGKLVGDALLFNNGMSLQLSSKVPDAGQVQDFISGMNAAGSPLKPGPNSNISCNSVMRSIFHVAPPYTDFSKFKIISPYGNYGTLNAEFEDGSKISENIGGTYGVLTDQQITLWNY